MNAAGMSRARMNAAGMSRARMKGAGRKGAGKKRAWMKPAGMRLAGWSRRAAERGSGTVLALATIAVVAAVTTATLLVTGAWTARHRAGIAADAAALAGADVAVGRAVGEPCAQARLVARANGAALAECAVAGAVVRVTAEVPYAGRQAQVSARAGPPGTP